MEMLSVESDAIEAIGYDQTSRLMRIRFTGGRVYDFCGVPPAVFEELYRAPSKGEYYNRTIKGRYDCGH